MKKIAFFVEGQTERLFVTRLLQEIAGERNIAIESVRASGGRNSPRKFSTITSVSRISQQKYYALISESCGDESVASDIREQQQGLFAQGHVKIIGLRDVYPKEYTEISRIERGLRFALREGVEHCGKRVIIILAVMEIESWFLAERSHFARISPQLSPAVVEAKMREISGDRFDQNTLEQAFPHPAQALTEIYQAASPPYFYKKKKAICERTLNALDYAALYLTISKQIERLGQLVQEIDNFLS